MSKFLKDKVKQAGKIIKHSQTSVRNEENQRLVLR